MRKMKKGMAILLAMVLTIAGLYSGSQVVRAENGGTETYNIDFSGGAVSGNVISYTIGEATVTATLPGTISLSNKVASLSPNDEITLSDNYNAETMQVRVYASDGFGTTLAVENGKTKLANKQTDGVLPTNLIFVVEAKNNAGGGSGNESGGNNEGNNGGTETYNIDFSEGAISGNVISYTVGEATVTATLPGTISLSNKVASLSPNDEITLSNNYNADTMQVRVYASDGFGTTLAVENGITKLANKQTDGVLPSDLKLVVEAKNNTGGGSGNESGGNNEGNNGGTETYNIDFSDGAINANVISYTIGESVVTATLPDTISLSNNVASLSPNDEITLSDNYNADTMQIRVYASDGFDTTLAVENGKTKLANKQNGGGLPSDLKLVIEAKNSSGGGSGNEPSGNEPGGNTFSGTVYFVWQGAEDRLCIHRFDNLTQGWTDDTTNYFYLSDVKDDSTNEAFTMSAANSVYWMWDNATEFLPNYQTYSSMKEALEADENTKRSYAIDPCGFENSANRVGTYGDRVFRAVIIDNTKYESISFSADANDYTYFPGWWDPILFTSTVDISNTTKENPAIYESFIEEPNIKFSTGANSTSAITSVTALDVPNSAVSVSESGGDWTIDFSSNFYDHVVLEVKTATETYYVEMERVAIQVHDNFGPGTAQADEKVTCEMYYPYLQNASDYDVYATIFYKDGSKEMQKLTASTTNNNGGTGLLFAEYEISYTSDMAGIAYNAVEAGSLSGNTFGGAYMGSGDGTYYDIDARKIIY